MVCDEEIEIYEGKDGFKVRVRILLVSFIFFYIGGIDNSGVARIRVGLGELDSEV